MYIKYRVNCFCQYASTQIPKAGQQSDHESKTHGQDQILIIKLDPPRLKQIHHNRHPKQNEDINNVITQNLMAKQNP